MNCIRATAALCAGISGAGMAQQADSIEGIWLGTLTAGATTLRIQVHRPPGGPCTFDSVDQKAFGIPCQSFAVTGSAVSFEVPAIAGKWSGTLALDGHTLAGTWTQGVTSLPLTMIRQTVAIAAEPPKFDSPLPSIAIHDLKPVIDRDFAAWLTAHQPALAFEGITIGVVQHGVRAVWTYGAAEPDSLFEIGSITKTFTATILAQMVQQGSVRLDQPVRGLLPAGVVQKPASGPEITLLDLSDQHSGLPRMPDNFKPADPANPYADYTPARLYEWVGEHGLALAPEAQFGYSNLGVGLLGQALANHAGEPYPKLLERQVTGPLGMHSTAIALTPALRARFLPAFNGKDQPAHEWNLDALAGAGAIRSDVGDMLTYLEAQLHPEKLTGASLEARTLPAAIRATHEIQAEASKGMHIALNWLHVEETGNFWHNGATGGYTSFAFFNPVEDFGVIVLMNRGPANDTPTDALGGHIVQRLRGVAATSIQP